ncbi:MAG: HAD-IA family hydrolase [Microcoleaceae cyanobacterium]
MNQQPQVIFLDAVGTLFGVRNSVGEVYRQLALQFGVDAPAELLNQAFFKSFPAVSPMAFPGAEPEQIPQLEFAWWQTIAEKTFQAIGVFSEFTDFSRFFQELYGHFATAEPWFVYPDVKPTLKLWRDRGFELGILSNFDSRLYDVLKVLELAEFFTSVTISTEVGAAKPDHKIFVIALQKHRCSPDRALHIGDSLKADYQGATIIGIPAILLNRSINQDQSFPTTEPLIASVNCQQLLSDILF